MNGIRRRRRLQQRLRMGKNPIPNLILPAIVILNQQNIGNFPSIQALKLGEYSYYDNYIDCHKSKLVNALAVCHLSRQVKEIIIQDIHIPESEKELTDFAINYLRIFGTKITINGQENFYNRVQDGI